MKEQARKCDRCQKRLLGETATGPGPSTPIRMEATGEILCGECVMNSIRQLMGGSAGLDDSQRRVLGEMRDELARRTGLALEKLDLTVQVVMGEDVQIRADQGRYRIELYFELLNDEGRRGESIDFLVDWMAEHPLSEPDSEKDAQGPNIAFDDAGVQMFFTVPHGAPRLTERLVAKAIATLVPNSRPGLVPFEVMRMAPGTPQETRAAMGAILLEWVSRQRARETIRFAQALLELPTFQVTCLVATRR